MKSLNENLKNEFWIKCEDKCFKKIKGLDAEVNSTAYILRCLVFSIIQSKSTNIRLKIKKVNTDIKKLTGVWKNDKEFITIEELEKK